MDSERCSMEKKTVRSRLSTVRDSLSIKSFKKRFPKLSTSPLSTPTSPTRKFANHSDFLSKSKSIENDAKADLKDILEMKIQSRRFDSNYWQDDISPDEYDSDSDFS